jgi:hypothetical protein
VLSHRWSKGPADCAELRGKCKQCGRRSNRIQTIPVPCYRPVLAPKIPLDQANSFGDKMSFRIPPISSHFPVSFANLSTTTWSNKSIAAAVGGSLFLLYLFFNRRRRVSPHARLPLPPGPKPVPILGNAPQFPQGRWYETFSEWSKTYGDMIYMNVLGTKMVIVNGLDVARDLLEKRGQTYSNRPEDGMNLLV